jgi:hypothetical protein
MRKKRQAKVSNIFISRLWFLLQGVLAIGRRSVLWWDLGSTLGGDSGFDDLHETVLQEHLTDVVLVDTLLFELGWDTEIESGNLVEDEEDEACDSEGVSEDGAAAGELVSQLDPVVVDPTAWELGETVKSGDVVSGEETGENVSDEATNTVESEDVETVVNLDEVLEVEGKVAGSGGDDTDWDGGVDWDVTASWGDTNETSNGTGAERDDGPLLTLTEVVDDAESQGTAGGSEVGVNGSVDGTERHVDSGTAVEAEPTEPKEDCSESDEEDVSGLVVGHLSTVITSSSANHQSIGEGTSTGRHVDGTATSEVERAEFEEPTGAVPGPASNWVVDDGGPDEEEDHGWEQTATLNSATQHDDTGNAGEDKLEEVEEDIWNEGRANGWGTEDVHRTEVGEITNEDIGAVGEGQGVTPEEPIPSIMREQPVYRWNSLHLRICAPTIGM